MASPSWSGRQADTVVWLDPSRLTVLRRVVPRTLRRVITREELWNGNREPWRNLYSPKPEDNVIVWAWTRHPHTRRRYEDMLIDGTWTHLRVVRLRTDADVSTFLAEVRSARPLLRTANPAVNEQSGAQHEP